MKVTVTVTVEGVGTKAREIEIDSGAPAWAFREAMDYFTGKLCGALEVIKPDPHFPYAWELSSPLPWRATACTDGWQTTEVRANGSALRGLCQAGWEPFAVTPGKDGLDDMVWLKRKARA